MKYLCIILFGFFIANVSLAEDATVEMLDKLDKRKMVFNQEIVRIDPGDTVFWKATDRGHNVEFISKNGVPAGVEKFKSKVGKDTEFTFTIPGIYAYWCVPHKTLGMIGFVIVGNDLSIWIQLKKLSLLANLKKSQKGLLLKLKGDKLLIHEI